MTFGENLESCIKTKGLKKFKVAELSGIKNGRFSKIIHDKSVASATDILAICNTLEITPNDLLNFQNKEVKANIDK